MVFALKLLLILISSVSAGPISYTETKLMSGPEVDFFGYEVRILYNLSYICGGVIISPNYVITAAHCTDGLSPIDLTVQTCSSPFPISILRIHQHPNYNPSTTDFDLSILHLDATFENTPVKLPYENQPIPFGAQALVSSCNFEPVIQQIVDSSRCFIVAGYKFCAVNVEGSEGLCKGASGSPLVVEGELLGVFSWGYGCVQELPNVYTNIPSLRGFIGDITGIY